MQDSQPWSIAPERRRSGPQGGVIARGATLIAMAALFLSFVLTLVLSTLGVVQSRVQDMRVSRATRSLPAMRPCRG